MILAAARDHALDLARSFVVGDRWRDIEMGLRRGHEGRCSVETGYGRDGGDPAPPATWRPFPWSAKLIEATSLDFAKRGLTPFICMYMSRPVHPLPGESERKARLLGLLDAFPARRVAVVGDLIADEFIYGRVARVSREAPVLILQYDSTEIVPGGAGNAANNVAALGARAQLIGVRREGRSREATAVAAAASRHARPCFVRRAIARR